MEKTKALLTTRSLLLNKNLTLHDILPQFFSPKPDKCIPTKPVAANDGTPRVSDR